MLVVTIVEFIHAYSTLQCLNTISIFILCSRCFSINLHKSLHFISDLAVFLPFDRILKNLRNFLHYLRVLHRIWAVKRRIERISALGSEH